MKNNWFGDDQGNDFPCPAEIQSQLTLNLKIVFELSSLQSLPLENVGEVNPHSIKMTDRALNRNNPAFLLDA